MIALDTDVLVINHFFQNDPRYNETRLLIEKVAGDTKGVTIFNLLELCGIIASANKLKFSLNLFEQYNESKDIRILSPQMNANIADEDVFWRLVLSECFSHIQRGMRLGDAAILWTLETNHEVDIFVTWNTKHFKDKTSLKVLTPAEFL
ncbi:MAG: hypothetical protein HY754_11025 [Nitrospirae bacterium]|nr:hypothetical protein [Nitrospirota bacterium]